MEIENLFSKGEKERITTEAAERRVDPEKYVSNLLEKGRCFDAVSRSRDRLIDEIRRVRSGERDIESIQLPSEIGVTTTETLPSVVRENIDDQPNYGWKELSELDQENIWRYAWHRHQQGASEEELRHEVRSLVGLAAFQLENSISRTDLSDFEEPTDRPGRAVDRFLRFLGHHPQV